MGFGISWPPGLPLDRVEIMVHTPDIDGTFVRRGGGRDRSPDLLLLSLAGPESFAWSLIIPDYVVGVDEMC